MAEHAKDQRDDALAMQASQLILGTRVSNNASFLLLVTMLLRCRPGALVRIVSDSLV